MRAVVIKAIRRYTTASYNKGRAPISVDFPPELHDVLQPLAEQAVNLHDQEKAKQPEGAAGAGVVWRSVAFLRFTGEYKATYEREANRFAETQALPVMRAVVPQTQAVRRFYETLRRYRGNDPETPCVVVRGVSRPERFDAVGNVEQGDDTVFYEATRLQQCVLAAVFAGVMGLRVLSFSVLSPNIVNDRHPVLTWHTDGKLSERKMPEYAGLFGLQPGKEPVPTQLIPARAVYNELTPAVRELLEQPCFVFPYGSYSCDIAARYPVFSYCGEKQLHIRYSNEAQSIDRQHALAMCEVEDAAQKAFNSGQGYEACLEPGDVLLWNNTRALHRRAAGFTEQEEQRRTLLRVWGESRS